MTAYCLRVTAINTMTAFCRFAFRIPQRGYYLGTIILNIYATCKQAGRIESIDTDFG